VRMLCDWCLGDLVGRAEVISTPQGVKAGLVLLLLLLRLTVVWFLMLGPAWEAL